MIRYYKYYITMMIVLFQLKGTMVTAQSSLDSCKQVLYNFYNIMSEVSHYPKSKALYIKATMENSFNEKLKMPKSNSTFELIISPTYYRYLNDYVSVYKDSKDMFVVVNPSQTITHYNPTSIKGVQGQLMSPAFTMRDSLLNKSTVISSKYVYEKTLNDSIKYQIIRLIPVTEVVSYTNVTMITYKVNDISKQVKSVSVKYTNENKIKKSIYTYDEINENYDASKLPPVRSLFLDKQGKLVSKYQGYELEFETNN